MNPEIKSLSEQHEVEGTAKLWALSEAARRRSSSRLPILASFDEMERYLVEGSTVRFRK